MQAAPQPPRVAIACGGTGGHLFPGLAVAERLLERGADVTLLVSQKDIDRQALGGDDRFEIVTLPAVGFSLARALPFAAASFRSWQRARAAFRAQPPGVLLSMGGFTSAPPAWAAHRAGRPVFLHEANAVPGRANRWLARIATRAYVYLPEAGFRLGVRDTRAIGMPVRQQFLELDTASCRVALGLDAKQPVLLVTGGSQGATGVNDALLAILPELAERQPGLQFIHLTGPKDEARVRAAYAGLGRRAQVRAFLTEMDLALGAATAVIARAGASSAAELAAVGAPALLIPYPHAADDHQTANARALERAGAVEVLRQSEAIPGRLLAAVIRLLTEEDVRARLRAGLVAWHRPGADAVLADDLLAAATGRSQRAAAGRPARCRCSPDHEFIPGHDRRSGPRPRRARRVRRRTARQPRTGSVVLSDEPLARRTTLRVGGPADLLVEPEDEAELARVVVAARRRGVSWRVLGRGSNLLVRDAGVRGMVICLGRPFFARIQVDGTRLLAGAGARLKDLSAEARRAGLAGLEFLSGIPGSVGGALRMNAGAWNASTFERLGSVRFMTPDGVVLERPAADVPAAYRRCELFRDHLALAAVFRGEPSTREAVEERLNDLNRRRWASQPAAPSAGCIFKNPAAIPAGRLVDELGLKGTRVGGACVSTQHGNFIVNDGNATAADVLALIDIIRRRARDERGIELETEVEIIGE